MSQKDFLFVRREALQITQLQLCEEVDELISLVYLKNTLDQDERRLSRPCFWLRQTTEDDYKDDLEAPRLLIINIKH